MAFLFWANGLKTFSIGGVHPEENKISAGQAIKDLEIPKMVSIPLSQHIGAPAIPVVEARQQVKVGELIAKGDGVVSANIHASASGTVTKVDKVLDSSGYKRDAILIRVKDDEWLESIDRSKEVKESIEFSSEEIRKKIADAGIVGLGGATFPSHVKLTLPKGKKADHLIVNGVECEPYLTADHQLMLEHCKEVIVGTRILMKAIEVDKAIIGIENNKKDAIEMFRGELQNDPNIRVQSLKVQYPQGGEKQLINAVLKREVPSGGLPIDVGVVVHNVGTAFAVYEAVQKNKPLVERIVTITGKQLSQPSNFRVRIGTSVSDLIEAAGGLPEHTGKIISGGPMMGKALNKTDVPIAKGTSGILLLDEGEAHRKPQEACIRCGKCVQACPMGLEPYLLMTECEKELFDRAADDRILDCIECGSCSYICPSNRSILDYIRWGKKTVIAKKRQSA